jgi:hypothetical protein
MIFSKYSSFQSFLDGTNETFYFFSFLSSGMACSFQISRCKISFQISKMKIQKISFSCGGMTNFLFKFQKKNHFKFQKQFFFQICHGGINGFFLDPRLPNLFKIYKN